MKAYTTISVIVLVVFALVPGLSSAEESGRGGHDVTTARQKTPEQATQQDSNTITSEEISKAYMNCLIEVDKTMSNLAEVTNLKAVRVEVESQRTFCANRKRDCIINPESAECGIFVEEFQMTVLDEGGSGKSK
jgi:hypothetical protein